MLRNPWHFPGASRWILPLAACAAALLATLAPRPAHAFCINCDVVPVHEYMNELTGRYLLLPAYDPEVAAVERGDAGPGWQRTGNDFTTRTLALQPVCRFYAPAYNAHFYTADAAECAAVKSSPDWVYEKSPFPAYAPVNGSCTNLRGIAATPIFRLSRVADHRYTAEPRIRQEMIDRGWTDEGVGFCVASGGVAPVQTVLWYSNQRLDSTQGCAASTQPCIAFDALPAMPVRVPPYLPPNYITVNPDFPTGLASFYGLDIGSDIYTSQQDPATILQHTFTTLNGAFYIDGRDRTSGVYAGISPMVELPGVAGTEADARLFVWRTLHDRELRVKASIAVGAISREGAGHAYGHPLVQFGDAKSGHSFVVTLQAYGTVPPGDFVGADARSGEPIVSTVFGASPRFGRAVQGTFFACSGNAASRCMTELQPFDFALRRADFQVALDLARSVDPALSGDPADYFLGRVAFHNETYLDARLGAVIGSLSAEVWFVE